MSTIFFLDYLNCTDVSWRKGGPFNEKICCTCEYSNGLIVWPFQSNYRLLGFGMKEFEGEIHVRFLCPYFKIWLVLYDIKLIESVENPGWVNLYIVERDWYDIWDKNAKFDVMKRKLIFLGGLEEKLINKWMVNIHCGTCQLSWLFLF